MRRLFFVVLAWPWLLSCSDKGKVVHTPDQARGGDEGGVDLTSRPTQFALAFKRDSSSLTVSEPVAAIDNNAERRERAPHWLYCTRRPTGRTERTTPTG